MEDKLLSSPQLWTKINMIGKMLVDIQLEINVIRRSQKELRDFLTDPMKLDVERFWRKRYESNPDENHGRCKVKAYYEAKKIAKDKQQH